LSQSRRAATFRSKLLSYTHAKKGRESTPSRFNVDVYSLSRYRVEKVGGVIHTEYWIPAEDLSEFNRNIHGIIEVIAEFR
jgi:hypothetical protein